MTSYIPTEKNIINIYLKLSHTINYVLHTSPKSYCKQSSPSWEKLSSPSSGVAFDFGFIPSSCLRKESYSRSYLSKCSAFGILVLQL